MGRWQVMRNSDLPPLPTLLDGLTDTVCDVLDAAARDGWSPMSVSTALGVIDVLVSAASAHGGPLAAALAPIPALTATAQRALADPLPPIPRKGTLAALAEADAGTDTYRTWRDAPVHRPGNGEPSSLTIARAAFARITAAEAAAHQAARESTAALKQAQRTLTELQAHAHG
ncbi:hypothetical protein [Streptomyces sp. NPDC087294]|uniref:hypothetical protein n=1 Tax=Streptomyces sp. NPDC087294 TaxID=3365777 RepID=UPI0037FB26B5